MRHETAPILAITPPAGPPLAPVSSVKKDAQDRTFTTEAAAEKYDACRDAPAARHQTAQPVGGAIDTGVASSDAPGPNAQLPKRKAVPVTRSTLMPRVQHHAYPKNPAWVLDLVNPHTRKRTHITLGKAAELSELQACMAAQRILDAHQNGQDPQAGQLTLGAYFDRHRLPYAQANLRSGKHVAGVFNRYIREALGTQRMDRLRLVDLQRAVDALRSGVLPTARRSRLADGTVYQVIAELKAIFNTAYKSGHISSNPAARLKQLTLRNRRQEVYTPEQLEKLFAAMADAPLKLRLLITILLGTGARISELLHARHSDLDVGRRTLHLAHTKSGRAHTLPLSEEVMRAYVELQAHAVVGNPYLFPAQRGAGPMSPPRKAFRQLLQRAGISNRTFHDCRRTAITAAVHAPGVTLMDASRLANHASVRITEQRYVVTEDARLRNAVTAIGKGLALERGLRPLVPSSIFSEEVTS